MFMLSLIFLQFCASQTRVIQTNVNGNNVVKNENNSYFTGK